MGSLLREPKPGQMLSAYWPRASAAHMTRHHHLRRDLIPDLSTPVHETRDLPDPRFSLLISAANRFPLPFLTRPYGHDSKPSSSLPCRLFPRCHSEPSASSNQLRLSTNSDPATYSSLRFYFVDLHQRNPSSISQVLGYLMKFQKKVDLPK